MAPTRRYALFVLASALAVFCAVLPAASRAFSSDEEMKVGSTVMLNDIAPGRYYIVFNPDDIRHNGGSCASVIGAELLDTGNGLEKYGTCFVNDKGVFAVIEASENIGGSYSDIVASGVVLDMK